jgi:hypothetical protein
MWAMGLRFTIYRSCAPQKNENPAFNFMTLWFLHRIEKLNKNENFGDTAKTIFRLLLRQFVAMIGNRADGRHPRPATHSGLLGNPVSLPGLIFIHSIR